MLVELGVPVQGVTPHRLIGCLAVVCIVGLAVAAPGVRLLRADVEPAAGASAPRAVQISSDFAQTWMTDAGGIAILRGRCRLIDGETVYLADQAVLWVSEPPAGTSGETTVTAYLEGHAERIGSSGTSHETTMLATLRSPVAIDWKLSRSNSGVSGTDDPLFRRAVDYRRGSRRGDLQPAQYREPGPELPPAGTGVMNLPTPGQARRIRVFPRSSIPYNVYSERTDTFPPEQVWIITGGVNLLVDGLDEFGTVDLAADRAVIWTQTTTGDNFNVETLQTRDTPYQVFLEGNIVIRQGQHQIRAEQAFYDAREERALLIRAELKSYIPQANVNVRVRADRIRQLSAESFHAQNAWVTTSDYGEPGYRVQASDVYLNQRAGTWFQPAAPQFDPFTGAPVTESTPWITSLNNTLLLGDTPVGYFPYFSGPADDPNIPLRRISVNYDRVFGAQLRTAFDGFQLFGMDKPEGVDWDLELDYLSERGPAIGSQVEYGGIDQRGNPFEGDVHGYYIHDDGEDNLGRDRRALAPDNNNRGRFSLQHRQLLPNNAKLLGELGYVSDRNFLEQYFENEFDEGKDQESLLYLQQDRDNWVWSGLLRPQVNDFENTTQWLPKLDLYGLGQPLLGDLVTWSSHSSLGYGALERADAPTDPGDVFTPLPYVADVEGAVLMTRHELAMPVNVGPFVVVPYALGEAAYWSETFTGDSIDRFYGSLGVRGSLQMQRIYPHAHSRIFNVNGLAHKMIFDADYSYSDSTEDLTSIAQYNEFDDNSQERFRQRFFTNTFGGVLPPMYDPRMYAVRTGAGQTVTAPYHELVDDQQALRLGWRHRLQTKVGPPDALRTKDWMALDFEMTYFPDEDRDNFGEELGLFTTRYRWNLGDRTTLLAGSQIDFFDGGQEIWDLGVISQRSLRGSVFVGVRQVSAGPLDSSILTASYSYRLSPKWVSTFGTQYDLGENENRGQSVTMTRIGADFLVHVGANYDVSRDNAGVSVSIEPRLGRAEDTPTQLGSLLGIR